MQSFCQFYAETCNLTDYLENCSVSFPFARRLWRLCLLPCISCISCPKDARKFCPFIYFLPTWHPFNDNLLEIVSCFLCCCLRRFSSLWFLFSGSFDAYLRVNCISFSNVLSLPSVLLLLLWQLCFPFLANNFLWKCWKAEKFIAVKCRRHTADSGTVRLTDRQRDREVDRQTGRLTKRSSSCGEKHRHATLLRQDMPNGKPLNWRRHMDETRADTARRCARCRRHNDNPVELSRTCHVWGMHFKRAYFIHSYSGIKPNNGINIIKCG